MGETCEKRNSGFSTIFGFKHQNLRFYAPYRPTLRYGKLIEIQVSEHGTVPAVKQRTYSHEKLRTEIQSPMSPAGETFENNNAVFRSRCLSMIMSIMVLNPVSHFSEVWFRGRNRSLGAGMRSITRIHTPHPSRNRPGTQN